LKEKKTNNSFKTLRKVLFRGFLVLFLLLLFGVLLLTIPNIQTKIAKYYTEKLNQQYKTDISVDKVAITIFGGVKLKDVLIKDHHKDTLIYSSRINTSLLDAKKLLDGDLLFGTLRVENLDFHITTYKGEKDNNLDKFINSFDTGSKSQKKFLMRANSIFLTNSHFTVIDENVSKPVAVDFYQITASLTDFKILGPNVTTKINSMSFKDIRGLEVTNLATDFSYSKTAIILKKLDLKTKYSSFVGAIILKYNREDFANFNDKVFFEVTAKNAKIATNDIRFFFKDIAANQKFSLSGNINGTLNNFTVKKLQLSDQKITKIVGNVTFKNLFSKSNTSGFYMKGTFEKISSSYDDLTKLLPTILGKKLPTALQKLGVFELIGASEITSENIDADFILNTKLGQVVANLQMGNIDTIDYATYSGEIALNNFDLGAFLNRKDLGKTTLDVMVEGKGFTEDILDTKFSGDIKSVYFQGYNFQNILADGKFKKPIFEGKLNINDPNLFLDFDGKINLGKNEKIFDFNAVVDYANLKNLKIINSDVAIFKGTISLNAVGNNLDTMRGDLEFTNASYQNPKDIYFFDQLSLNSSFDSEGERTVNLFSSDKISATIVGKYQINQITKMVENSLGSLYTNYKENKLKKGQYIRFNLSEFNKIVEILDSKILLDQSTTINGSINGDNNAFKMNFKTATANIYDVAVSNLNFQIDNKNPLFNIYIEADSASNKYYKIRDFSLINLTGKDTLSFRTEFKGGEKGNDKYNLNLYHTLNKEKQNIIGFNKSQVQFKEYEWVINEAQTNSNKIVFDNYFKNFTFDNFLITHQNESVALNGIIEGTQTKDLELIFKDVNLNKITPTVNKFRFGGNLDGSVYFKQNNSVYQPNAKLKINNLEVNENLLGTLLLEISGDDSLSKFQINSEIINENFNSFKAEGNLEVQNQNTFLDIDLYFKKFNLGILSNLGGDVLSNIRGFASGTARINGNVNDLDYNGRLFVDDVGLTIPYLNVDYSISNNSVVDVTKDKFIIRRTKLQDTKFNTEGFLQGIIQHEQFSKWQLDLDISASRLLALNTEDSEDAAYFGVAFIKGDATIKGPTEALLITVDAESEKGTDIKIPINDAESISDNKSIHFLTKEEKYNTGEQVVRRNLNYGGLEMKFDFNITRDATIEVILDRNSGHGMRGSGSGNLLFAINTGGKFEMVGDFVIYDGVYNFKYGGLIDKKFEVKRFGSISWSGDPLRATLDLEAIYKTTANPAVLLNNASFNRKIPVEVSIGIKGNLANPEPEFNINFPNVSSVLKSEIETRLSDKDTRQTQALYLLAYRGFLSPEGINQSQFANTLYERASALFGEIFQDDDAKIQLGIDFVQADRTLGAETEGRFGVSLSTKINERISINGKVGVPVGGINESAIVGNVELQYRVNEDGTLNLRVFNRENDINYIGQGVGYTQGVGMSYEVDFDNLKELLNKIFKRIPVKEVQLYPEYEDDNYLPENIRMQTVKSKKDTTPKSAQRPTPNRDARPNEE
jgi:hypothetical protein